MAKILRFEIIEFGDDPISLEMPLNARILTVQNKENRISMWAEVNTLNGPTELRYFLIVGTCDPEIDIDTAKTKYIGTVQLFSYVWHVYEVIQ